MSDTDYSDTDDWKCDPADLMWEPPCSLRLSYWKRSAETQQAKDDHVDYLETLPYSREELILRTTLANADIAIEKNMFPYATPPNIEHWTLWSREELSHRSICRFIEEWCEESSDPVAKKVVEWNYEENAHRSFDVPHVHVFFRLADGQKEEVCSSGLLSHSLKRSFSRVVNQDFNSSSSTSSSSSSSSTSPLSDDSDMESSAPSKKKVCSSRVNLLSSSSSSFSSVSDSDGETDREDLSDIEVPSKKVRVLTKPRTRPVYISNMEEGLTDDEDEQ